MRALANKLDRRVAARPFRAGAMLAPLLRTTAQTQDKVQRALLLDIVVTQGTSILQLLARKDQALLVRRNALLVLDLRLDCVVSVVSHTMLDRVAALTLQRNCFPCKCLYENLHGLGTWSDQANGKQPPPSRPPILSLPHVEVAQACQGHASGDRAASCIWPPRMGPPPLRRQVRLGHPCPGIGPHLIYGLLRSAPCLEVLGAHVAVEPH